MRFSATCLPSLSGLLACGFLATVQNAQTVNAAMFADKFSAEDFSLTAVYDDSTNSTAFTLQSSATGSAYGWHGIGTGRGMGNSNMVIAWVNSAGTVTVSNRYSHGDELPDPSTALTLPAITRNDTGTATTSSGTTVQWSQPGFPNTADRSKVTMIWAMNPSGPSSSATDASFSRHTAEGRMTLDLTKPYTEGSAGASTVVSSSGSEQGEGEEEETDRSMSKRNMIVWAHMIIGIFTWLLVFPLGVFIGRFGRTTMRWFPKHRIVQVIGIVLAVVAMFLGFGTIWAQGGHHMNERHHTLGLSLTLLAVFQGLLGQFGHMLWHAKRIRIQNFLHIIIGITIIPLATWNMGLGLELWEWAPPDYAAYILYAWAGFLGLVYILGLAFFFPRELKANKRAQAERAGLARVESDEVTRVESDPPSSFDGVKREPSSMMEERSNIV